MVPAVAVEDSFASIARRFTSFVKAFDAHPRDEFVRQVEPLLLELYSAALRLGRGHLEDDDDLPEGRMTTDEWWEFFQRLGRHLGSYDAYSFVFDPYDLGSEAGTAKLSDDLADIYRELDEGLALFDAGRTGEAVWQWRFTFDSHWGRHAAHAIYALHILRIDHVR